MTEAVLDAPVVRVDGVTKHYDGTHGRLTALEDIAFSLSRGEVLAFVGPSGCGKSTLLNIIAGIHRADAGHITVLGRNTEDGDAESIGYVFQDDRLFPWRSALRNVTFSLEAGHMARAERDACARATLALVGLTGFEASYPHQLSGGMRARVALARSLVLEPKILLMDEPFGRLDPMTKSQMHAEFLRLKTMLDVSTIFVTHDVDEAVALADRIIVLAPRPGRIKATVAVDLPHPRVGEIITISALALEIKSMIG